jgi:hypothetical protein
MTKWENQKRLHLTTQCCLIPALPSLTDPKIHNTCTKQNVGTQKRNGIQIVTYTLFLDK